MSEAVSSLYPFDDHKHVQFATYLNSKFTYLEVIVRIYCFGVHANF